MTTRMCRTRNQGWRGQFCSCWTTFPAVLTLPAPGFIEEEQQVIVASGAVPSEIVFSDDYYPVRWRSIAVSALVLIGEYFMRGLCSGAP